MSEYSRRYGAGSDVDALASSLNHLLQTHRQALQDEKLEQEVEMLLRWAERQCFGSTSAEQNLQDKGQQHLQHVRDRLKMACEEHQRLQAETPAGHDGSSSQMQQEYVDAQRKVSAIIDHLLQHEQSSGSIAMRHYSH